MFRVGLRERLSLVFVCAAAYFLMDAPLRVTGVLPAYAGIKNFLPFSLGLFFGYWGVTGCVIGCVLSGLATGAEISAILYECVCTMITGLGMFYGWHFLAKSHRISFKTINDYGRYTLLVGVMSALCIRLPVASAYFITGMVIGVLVNILFSSVLYFSPVMPHWCTYEYDAVFCLMNGADSLDDANELMESAALSKRITMKRVFEIQSCLEEILIRILNAVPEARIHVFLEYGDAISVRMHYEGRKYNPFVIKKDEDEIDIMSLKIIKHRALRASFAYSEGINKIHVVV